MFFLPLQQRQLPRGQEPRTAGDKSPHTPKGRLTDRCSPFAPNPVTPKRRPSCVHVCERACERVSTQATHSLAWARLRTEEVSGQRGGRSVRMSRCAGDWTVSLPKSSHFPWSWLCMSQSQDAK